MGDFLGAPWALEQQEWVPAVYDRCELPSKIVVSLPPRHGREADQVRPVGEAALHLGSVFAKGEVAVPPLQVPLDASLVSPRETSAENALVEPD